MLPLLKPHVQLSGLPQVLRQGEMVVEDQGRQQEVVFDMLAEINRTNTRLRVNIILGMACNFSCPYCYEGTMKGDLAMDEAMVAGLIDFLKQRYGRGATQQLTLDFYGGEPLLYTKQIKAIATGLKPYVEECGGEFSFTLVTNGSLLNEKKVDELLPLGLRAAKVTIDGPADLHNLSRPFKNGTDSFETIIKNVGQVCGKMKIGLGCNYTKDNYQRFPELLDYLQANDLGPESIGPIQFAPVMAVNDEYANPEFSGGCASSSEPWLIEAQVLLQEELLRRGYECSKIGPSPCAVDVDGSFTVHCDGTICKCVALIGRPEFVVGDINQGIGDMQGGIYHPQVWREHEECRDCEYLPLCFGGCCYSEYQRSGDMGKVDCQKALFDGILEPMVKLDVKYYQAGGAGLEK